MPPSVPPRQSGPLGRRKPDTMLIDRIQPFDQVYRTRAGMTPHTSASAMKEGRDSQGKSLPGLSAPRI